MFSVSGVSMKFDKTCMLQTILQVSETDQFTSDPCCVMYLMQSTYASQFSFSFGQFFQVYWRFNLDLFSLAVYHHSPIFKY